MPQPPRRLSELEGAILSEIEHRGRQTAFQVRKAFADSLSLEWKGSAGAVYPAVKRLEKEELLHASDANGGRSARHLTLTDQGRTALAAWACDPVLASSVGVDPFRLRAGIWAGLTAAERSSVFCDIAVSIEANVRDLTVLLGHADPVERVRLSMAIAAQNSRLTTLRAEF